MPEIAERFLLFALCHSLLAVETVKSGICRRPPISRFYRLSYNMLALGTFAWVLEALPGSSLVYSVTGPPSLILRGIQAGALVLLCRCAVQTGLGDFAGISQMMTGTEPAPRLTRTGCYRFVRHPQYSLAVIFLLAAPTVSINYALLTILSAGYFILGSFIEETRLRQHFGSEYCRYQTEVPMFVPNVRRRQSNIDP